MAEFERANLNSHTKCALAECSLMMYVVPSYLVAVVSKLAGCKVPTLEIYDATRFKAGQLVDVSFTRCCSRLIMIKILARCLLSIARWMSECRVGPFQPARSSTFSIRSPQRIAQIDSNLVSTLLLLSCRLP